jgi:hypothetical protein
MGPPLREFATGVTHPNHPAPNPMSTNKSTPQRMATQNENAATTPHNPTPEHSLTPSLHAQVSAALDCQNTSVNKTSIHNPLARYTMAEMPPIHNAHPLAAFDYIDLNVLDQWERTPGGKLLAHPFDKTVFNPELHNSICAKIFAAVTEITLSQEVGVAGPSLSYDAIQLKCTPTTFLIYNLSESQCKTLLQ